MARTSAVSKFLGCGFEDLALPLGDYVSKSINEGHKRMGCLKGERVHSISVI